MRLRISPAIISPGFSDNLQRDLRADGSMKNVDLVSRDASEREALDAKEAESSFLRASSHFHCAIFKSPIVVRSRT